MWPSMVLLRWGVALSDAGQDLADLEGQLVYPSKPDTSGPNKLLAVLGASKASIVDARLKLGNAGGRGGDVDVRVIPGGQQAAFLKARGTIASALAAIDEFQRLVPALTELLGGNGARTYLSSRSTPAELRPGGGFMGTFTALQADHGALTSVKGGSSGLLSYPRGSQRRAGLCCAAGASSGALGPTSWSFFDSNFFPDFPQRKRVNASQPKLGVKIDGVIAIDYYTVAKLLEVTGPLVIPGFGITVNSTELRSPGSPARSCEGCHSQGDPERRHRAAHPPLDEAAGGQLARPHQRTQRPGVGAPPQAYFNNADRIRRRSAGSGGQAISIRQPATTSRWRSKATLAPPRRTTS